MRKQYLRLVWIFAVFLAGILFSACGEQSYLQRHSEKTAEADEAAKETVPSAKTEKTMPEGGAVSEADTSEQQTGHTTETETEQICAQITGAVNNPGVYFLEENARLFDLVEAAGGLTADADPDAINQARVISDGEQVIVRTREQTALEQTGGWDQSSANPNETAEAHETSGNGRIDLNTADVAALSELPGIGAAKAAAIVAYRSEHGRFSSAEEIMQVPGIKSGTYEKIKDRIAVR